METEEALVVLFSLLIAVSFASVFWASQKVLTHEKKDRNSMISFRLLGGQPLMMPTKMNSFVTNHNPINSKNKQ